jgi:predicted dehydrogenase
MRFGIIGCGHFAERAIMPAIRAADGAELVAIQKRDIAAARALADSAGIPVACSTPEELVSRDDIDAVFIASANSAHAPETVLAARHGKHVIVEKPMALTVAESEMMIRECYAAGVALMVGHMVRLSPAVERVRQIVLSGRYGPPVFARADFVYDMRGTKRAWLTDARVAGGGPVYDIGVHCLDTLRYVLGQEVVSVKAQMDPLPDSTQTEITAVLGLVFSSGMPGSVYCSYASPFRSRELQVVFPEAVVTLDGFTGTGQSVTLNVDVLSEDGRKETMKEDFDVPDLYVKEIERFVEAVRLSGDLYLTGENGLRNMQILEAARLQCEQGR